MSATVNEHDHYEFCQWLGKKLAECRSDRTHKSAICEYAFREVQMKMLELGLASREQFIVRAPAP